MPLRLVVAEKPSVARDLARVLGVARPADGFFGSGETRVAWCVGHLVELCEPEDYDPALRSWGAAALPILPDPFRIRVRDGSADDFAKLKLLLRRKDLGEVVNACDAGREGELIFAWAYQLAGCKAPVRRLWISSLTDDAIAAGFAALREPPRALEAAARARAEADWMVGINATRAMTVAARGVSRDAPLLSVGRVQTPTLALLVERRRAIEGFTARPFFRAHATFGMAAGPLRATWFAGADHGDVLAGEDEEGDKSSRGTTTRIGSAEAAQAIADRVRGQPGIVARADAKESREKPPFLYDLTSLQREASARFHWPAQRTLDVAQSLYEKKKVLSYPRTDSRHLGTALRGEIPALLASLRFGPYERFAAAILGGGPRDPGARVFDDAEVGDHHAIIPTRRDPREAGLDADEKRLYDLVARRLLAAFSADARFRVGAVEVEVGPDRFRARGRVCLEAGWRDVDPPRGGREAERLLPALIVGEQGRAERVDIDEDATRPPKPHTDASLLGAMERAGDSLDDAELRRAMKKSGLGTPATRASILETLVGRGYVLRDGTTLTATDSGCALIEALPVPALKSPSLTGAWEARLADLAEGTGSQAEFSADVRTFVADAVRQIGAASLPGGVLRGPVPTGERLGACPRCAADVRQAERGFSCVSCVFHIPAKLAGRAISRKMATALLTDRRTADLKGWKSKAGAEFTAALRLDDDFAVAFSFAESDPLGDCPRCGLPVRRRGKVFSCDAGRECGFVVFATMSGRSIADADVSELLTSRRGAPRDGFVDRDGRPFIGRLDWDGKRVSIVRVDPRVARGVIAACPRCGGEVAFRASVWRCGGCALELPAVVAGRELRANEVKSLLLDGRTARLHGLRQRDGTPMRAGLVWDGERVGLAFDAAAPPIPQGGPPPAFGERVDCPRCLGRSELDPGYVIRGRAAWGCSRWSVGCTLRLPAELFGLALTDDDARRLLGKHRATTFARRAVDSNGTVQNARLHFVDGGDPPLRVETRAAARRARDRGDRSEAEPTGAGPATSTAPTRPR